MRKLLLAWFALLLSLSALAQTTIRGRVISKADKSGVPGATIARPGTPIGVLTEADGSFSLTLSATDTLPVRL
ncbi:hypothetical protein EJV47_27410 [Hymenobacter gummosus]|uniref:Carboxypeptidase-like regulatory domain-containing protein n=1 Tax=Hymenobacter gummosus TaxID=1776032 RepID=A0A431TTW6_9BACT|nr:carboxypeptidase-like regulatory domain-containing protein [Hymenobacter gummosus]RTQ44723.1 hypothetical protein EJV47_27410 [Hymenobacter gummosus]